MNREADVLQDRIELLSLGGRRIETQERIGGGENKEEENSRDGTLDGENIRLEARRQISPEDRDQRGKKS